MKICLISGSYYVYGTISASASRYLNDNPKEVYGYMGNNSHCIVHRLTLNKS